MHVPFAAGSHFLLFACIDCDELPEEQYSDMDSEIQSTYGNQVCRTYSLCLNPPDIQEAMGTSTDRIVSKPLTFSAVDEAVEDAEYVGKTSNDSSFKVGGTPAWINYAVNLSCHCGASIDFLCQIPDNFDFDAHDQQAKWHSLFLGNAVFVLGCSAQCLPHSLLVVCDN